MADADGVLDALESWMGARLGEEYDFLVRKDLMTDTIWARASMRTNVGEGQTYRGYSASVEFPDCVWRPSELDSLRTRFRDFEIQRILPNPRLRFVFCADGTVREVEMDSPGGPFPGDFDPCDGS